MKKKWAGFKKITNVGNRRIIGKKKSHQGHQLTKEVFEMHFHAFVHWKRTVFCSFKHTGLFFQIAEHYKMLLHDILFTL